MPGSMIWVDYISDDGETYSIAQDESNAAAAGNTPTASAATPKLPLGYEPRHLFCVYPTNGSKRKIVIGDPANALWDGTDNDISLVNYASATPAAVTFDVQGRVGEKRLRGVSATDTGLLTG